MAKIDEENIKPKKENLILNLRISTTLNELLEAELTDKAVGLSKSQLVRIILGAYFVEKAKKDMQNDMQLG
jgi:hypothetical protein